jgi:hypothetical protein
MKFAKTAWFFLFVFVFGCNWTDGPCYYADEENASNAGVGVGGSFGVSVGVGVGGDGDYGAPEPQSTEGEEEEPICNKSDLPRTDDETELGELVCGKNARGVECMTRCGLYGVLCPGGMSHPKKADGGLGLLWKCCNCKDNQQCKYIYENGDSCTFFLQRWSRDNALCIYEGGQ